MNIDNGWTITLADVRAFSKACGDPVGGLMLGELLQWWPKKRSNQKGIKKSYADWKEDMGIARYKIDKAVPLLTGGGWIETYEGPWGHFASKSTFYVLTPKALALKALADCEQVVSGALADSEQVLEPESGKALADCQHITENLKEDKSQNQKKTSATPTAIATDIPASKQSAAGKGQPLKKKNQTYLRIWMGALNTWHTNFNTELTGTDATKLRQACDKVRLAGQVDPKDLVRFFAGKGHSKVAKLCALSAYPKVDEFVINIASVQAAFLLHQKDEASAAELAASIAKYAAEPEVKTQPVEPTSSFGALLASYKKPAVPSVTVTVPVDIAEPEPAVVAAPVEDDDPWYQPLLTDDQIKAAAKKGWKGDNPDPKTLPPPPLPKPGATHFSLCNHD
jgi:hypothetical protein